jgi:predicted ATP-binding protein involved in virulence
MENQNFILKIDKLCLKNFRNLEDFEITFEDQLTVLIGENGGGKTSVLDAIAGCLRYLVGEIRRVYDPERFSIIDITVGTDALSVDLGFKGTLSPFHLAAHYSKDAAKTNYHSTGIETVLVEGQEPLQWSLVNRLRAFYGQSQQDLPVIAYYPSSQGLLLNPETVEKHFLYRYNTYEDSLGEQVINLKVLKKWLIHQSNLNFYDSEEDEIHLFQTLTDALVGEKGILNDEQERAFTHFRVSFKGVSGAEGNFLFTKNGKKIYDYQLSSGERMLMLLVVDLARRCALASRSKNPLKDATGIVLIDEIDLHLHPRWQRNVLHRFMFLFPKIQFIVATHSPLILSELYSKHIRSIEKGKVYGVRDTYGHEDADDMLQIMGLQSVTRQKIKQIHLLLRENKIVEAQNIRNTIVAEGTFTPLLEIDLFIQRKLKFELQ